MPVKVLPVIFQAVVYGAAIGAVVILGWALDRLIFERKGGK
jgi:hypothetical protein